MTRVSVAEVMPAEQSAALADFARACKAAARSVSLYPATHPAIRAALGRVSAASTRLVTGSELTLAVHPDMLLVDGRPPARPDPAIGELASLLHDRLVGTLRIERGADDEDWRTLLLLLARAPEDLIVAGGIARAWVASGRRHFEIREIDYAEVLRERAGGDEAEWDRIVAHYLRGEATSLDERAIAALLEAIGNGERFAHLLDRLQHAESGGATVGARAAALLQLLRAAADALGMGGRGVEAVAQAMADSAAALTADMMLAFLQQRQSASPEDAELIDRVIERMSDHTIATFVASSVASEGAATARLAQAFQTLVPEIERRAGLLEQAHDEAAQGELGQEDQFEELWRGAANMLLSYSDETYVSVDYSRELSDARGHAVDVERVSDDPPERVQEWLATIGDAALRDLDLTLLLDLLRLEQDPEQWQSVAMTAVPEIERRTILGEVDGACRIVSALVADTTDQRRDFQSGATRQVIERLASGLLVRHVVLNLRKAEESEVPAIAKLCHTIGPALVRPLAEALAVEENPRAIRRLREVLLGFGAAGRQSVEQLKSSSNPSVRRTAIDLLRVFGGHEALPELASMLDDSDPQVQRESIRAIVLIGTNEAYAVLERALVAGGHSRDTVLQELIALRDEKAVPLLCYVLKHTEPRGALAQAHAKIIDVLGGLNAHPESTRTLRHALHRGDWWAPFRTAALRKAAATSLRRIGSPDALAVLEEAVASGSRGVRNAARQPFATMPTREGESA